MLQFAFRLARPKVKDAKTAYRVARHCVQNKTSVVVAMFRVLDRVEFDSIVIGGEPAGSLVYQVVNLA